MFGTISNKCAKMEKTRNVQQGSSPGVGTRLLAGGIAGATETMITVSKSPTPGYSSTDRYPLVSL